ncbi:unnamed protein product [Clavelina lepadiformis]|uniref:Uncharacterized protein n=1 Tax=Clavelina lepadiformis TaxID=159417 RepID=A0ABP0FM62_CLALP
MALSFRPPDPMQFVSRHVAESWRDLEMSFSIFFEAAELSKKPRKTQVAILLNCAGPQAQKIFQRFKFSGDEDSQEDYKTVLKKFRDYCEPRKNPIFNTYKFWQRDQQPGELFDNWVMDLRQLLDGCDYTDPDRHLRDKVVFGIHDPQVREKLIQHADLTLAKAIDICHAAEASKAQFKEMNDRPTSTHQINSIKRTSHYTRPPPTRSTPLNCRYCGTQHEPRQCPAFSKICRNCGKRNHFAAVCRSQPKQVHDIETQSQELQSDAVEVIHVGSINSVSNHRQTKMRADLHVQNNLSKVYSVTFKLDTGADANILPYKVYKKLNQSSLMKTKAILSAFDFCHIPILGEQACDCLDLVNRVDLCTSSTQTLDQITHEHADVFKGMADYEKENHTKLNPDVEGVIQHPAQTLISRRPTSKLQVSTKMLELHNVRIEANLEQRQQMQKKYYDRGTKPLPELQKGDVVYYNRNRSRAQGIIINRRSEPWSYQLQNEYGDIRRNRRQLYKTARAQPEFQFEYYEDNDNTRSFDNHMNTPVTRPCSTANDITDVCDTNVRVS